MLNFIGKHDGSKENKRAKYLASVAIGEKEDDFIYSKWETIQIILNDTDLIIYLPEFIVIEKCQEIWISNFEIVEETLFQKATQLILERFKSKLEIN